MPYRVENIVRKEEIACYEQFLIFSQCFPQLYILTASKGVIVWELVNNSLPNISDFQQLYRKKRENTEAGGIVGN